MDSLIEEYQQGYSKILNEIEGLTEEQLMFKPSFESWSIREIIIHVADAELVHIHRMKAVLAEENPLLTAFDQDAWTNSLQTQRVDHRIYLSLYKTLVDSFIPILNQTAEKDYLRVGTHNQAGQLTFKELLEHSIEHVDTHIEQIRRVKQSFSF